MNSGPQVYRWTAFRVLGFLTVAVLAVTLLPFTAERYVLAYAMIIILLLSGAWASFFPVRVLLTLILIYLGVGLLNISSFRGYTGNDTIQLYLYAALAFAIPIVLFSPRKMRKQSPELGSRSKFQSRIVIAFHILAAYLALVYVYAAIGNVFYSQQLRLQIPTEIGYAVKSVLVICGVIPILYERALARWVILVLCVAPAIMIGSRGTVVAGVLAYALTMSMIQDRSRGMETARRGNRGRAVILSIVAGSVITLGFFLRRRFGAELIGVDQLVSIYFDDAGFWIYPIIPFYFGFKETVGLTNRIVEGGITNDLLPIPLFFADLATVLPGENLAAGQALGLIFGSVTGGGLTPGLLGGLYLDFGAYGIVVFSVIASTLAFAGYFAKHSYRLLPLYSTMIAQFLHLFHRGFVKPEYVTTLALSMFYTALLFGFVFRANKLKAISRK